MRKFTICFTGHRPNKLPWKYNENSPICIKFKDNLTSILENAILNGYTYFITGLALGFDTICAEIVLLLKEKYNHIKLECAIPCLNQEIKWNKQSKKRYYEILSKCDKKTIISPIYTQKCMQERNEYMVNNSSVVIAYWNKSPSGTANTINYAKKLGRKIRFI